MSKKRMSEKLDVSGVPIEEEVGRCVFMNRFNDRVQKSIIENKGNQVESLYPNDSHSKNDVAFGYLKNGEIVVATDFQVAGGSEVGYIAHIEMLRQKGYAKSVEDPRPSVDYFVRGIVKADLDGNVVFWEQAKDLLENKNKFRAVLECLRQLKSRALIRNDNLVFGSGVSIPIGSVEELLDAEEKS
jgi:hypothetical protein